MLREEVIANYNHDELGSLAWECLELLPISDTSGVMLRKVLLKIEVKPYAARRKCSCGSNHNEEGQKRSVVIEHPFWPRPFHSESQCMAPPA
jgi:hypothetical protein